MYLTPAMEVNSTIVSTAIKAERLLSCCGGQQAYNSKLVRLLQKPKAPYGRDKRGRSRRLEGGFPS